MARLRRAASAGTTTPRRLTNAGRKRSASFLVGTTLVIAGVMCLGVGAIAWRLPAPEPVRVIAATPAFLPNTTVFDSGVTLFAAVPDHRNPPAPQVFSCRVTSGDGAPEAALVKPVPELVGSRVVEGAALTGVIDLGHTVGGAEMRCVGPAAAASQSMWVLPSKDGLSDQPLALVVAALFLIGLGALVHPRTRSM